jgi:uncharacterized protein (DUF2249 family)/hemerythrin-like domain-containing protein
MKTHELDAREIPPTSRLRTIFDHLLALAPGESMVITAPHAPTPLLRMLLSDYPGRFDFAPLELGPEAWRWQFVARIESQPRTVTGYLVWDHRRMEALLTATSNAAEAGHWGEAHTLARGYATALRRHADLEDEALFPAFEKACGGLGDGPTQHMREEHVEVRRGIDQLLRAVAARDAAAVADARDFMQQAAIEHHAKEEEILFPAVDATFDEARLDALVRSLMMF